MATANDVVKQAIAWLGYSEANYYHKAIIDIYNLHKPLPRGYAVKYSDEWCATFVSAVAIKTGATNIIPLECSCNYMIAGFKSMGRWIENDAYTPKAGDIIFYDWQDSGKGDNTGSSDHVGIVERVCGGYITVIEGNKNEVVARRVIKINSKFIRDAEERLQHEAEQNLIDDLTEAKLFVKKETMIHSVGHSERTGVVVEPRLSKQWFVKMDILAKQVLENDEYRFVPERFMSTLERWLENI